MRDFLMQANIFVWLVVFAWLIYGTGKLLEWLQRPKAQRPIVDWPDRSSHRSPVGPRPGQSSEPDKPFHSYSASHALRMLKNVTLRDFGAVERLIQYEIKRDPGISRDEAICRAYASWLQDNR